MFSLPKGENMRTKIQWLLVAIVVMLMPSIGWTQGGGGLPKCKELKKSKLTGSNLLALRNQCFDQIVKKGMTPSASGDRGYTGAEAIAQDLVKALAQAVLNKVKRAGLRAAADFMKKAIKCDSNQAQFPNTCKVFETDVKKWLFQPKGLLEAFLEDLLEMLNKLNSTHAKNLGTALKAIQAQTLITELITDWKIYRNNGVREKVINHFEGIMQETFKSKQTCKEVNSSNMTEKYLKRSFWAVGKCLQDAASNTRRPTASSIQRKLAACKIGTFLDKCVDESNAGKKKTAERILLEFTALSLRITKVFLENDMQKASDRKQAAKQAMTLLFDFVIEVVKAKGETAKAAKDKVAAKAAEQFATNFKNIAIGIIDEDWAKLTSSAINVVIKSIEIATEKKVAKEAKKASDEAKKKVTGGSTKKKKAGQIAYNKKKKEIEDQKTLKKTPLERFLKILSILSQYTATYGKDTKDSQDTRVKIIENLMEEFTDRSAQLKGVVFSIGGSLTASGGAEFYPYKTSDRLFGSFAPSLKLGFAMQTYHENRHVGFHLELGILDLGNYMKVETLKLNEGNLDWAQILSPSITAAVWFGPRETPLYFGLSASVLPLSNDGNAAFKFQAVFGIYIPIFDLGVAASG